MGVTLIGKGPACEADTRSSNLHAHPNPFMAEDTYVKEGTIYERELSDGRLVEVTTLTFGRARIVISPDKNSVAWTDGW